ncbi:cytochrome c biogenesis CcdA family protein [Scleromatobacter humisilvae]|uniref:Cytochrome c biogenesis CcdA family protein n=1 Tax=Scleromatobacter humisilvae TaxID=2897159 RepID=A0A9X1YI03_9BURK|nr:cytochrome c biogenesis CcdA family protein [Scleromatobacter humisilvae]MCK9685240.1 cytochrome c biogenesis CcdA family protein [Scleromatobacter humisilvae]
MPGFAQPALSVAAGALTTLSPCVFPLLPVIVGGAVQRHRAAPVAMGLGMAITFTLIGLLVGGLGGALSLAPDDVRHVGAWLLIAFGVVMLVPPLERRFSSLMTPLASSANAATSRVDGGALAGAFALGGLLGLVWSPCAGPLLGSTLALVATACGAARGAFLLGLFGIGAALPLVGAAYASRAGFGRVRAWVLAHAGSAKRAMGALLLLVGVLILSGGDHAIEAWVNDRLPDAWLALTTRI